MSEAPKTERVAGTADGVDMLDLMDSIDLNRIPIMQPNCSLGKTNNSLRCMIMREAWQDQDIDIDSPGTVDQYYFPQQGFLVIDFNDE